MKSFLILFLILSSTLNADIFDFKTIKADFTQTITNEQNNSITYYGILYIKKPENILWQYSKPVNKSIYINKHNVTIYEPELYQAIVFKQKKELNPIRMFNDSKYISSTKRVSRFDDSDIIIAHDKYSVKSLSFTDKVGNDNNIEFTTFEKNRTIPDSLFIFKATDDIDIIRE